jgi:hypothetical protein
MTRERHKAGGRLARFAALPALALALAAQAQTPGSVQDYHLPPAPPKPTPTAAGPVDTDHPVAAPTRPAPTPTPSAAPSPAIALPSSSPSPSAAAPVAPAPRRTPPRQVEQPAPSPSAAGPVPTPSPAVSPAATPGFEAPPNSAPSATVAPVPERERGSAWPWLAGGGLAVLVLGGLVYWRRRTRISEEVAHEPESVAPEPQPSPPAALTPPPRPEPRPVAPPPPPAAPLPEPAFGPRPLELQLEARHLSRAMVNATLAYRLTLTNHALAALGPLRIAGDITSAHASLSAQEQLALNGDGLPTLHAVPGLAAGESLALSGELRLPLASILPIHSGGARVFVPLARFRVEAEGAVVATRVFVVGQASGAPGGALRPFPLDRGPGVDRSLDQHELELPA